MSDIIKIKEEYLVKIKNDLNLDNLNKVKSELFGKNGKLATNIAKIGAKITGAATALGAALGLTDDAATKSRKAAGIEKKGPGFMSKAFQSARLAKGAGLVGIVLTAGFAVFDTVTAGFEEASRQLDKENPDRAGSRFGRAIEVFKASLAGLVNSLTFGLFDITNIILNKEFFLFEYFIKDFRLLPLPLMKTAIFFLPGYFST